MTLIVNVTDGGAGVRVQLEGDADDGLLEDLLAGIHAALADGRPVVIDLHELDGETTTIDAFVEQVHAAADRRGVPARVVGEPRD